MRIIQRCTASPAQSGTILSLPGITIEKNSRLLNEIRLLREENKKITQENQKLKSSDAVIEEMGRVKTTNTFLHVEITSLKRQLGSVEDEVFGLEAEVEELEVENGALAEDVRVTRVKLEISIEELDEMKARWAGLRVEKIDLGRRLSERTEACEMLLADVEKLKIEKDSLGEDLTTFKNELSTTKSKLAEEETAHSSLQAQFRATDSELSKAHSLLSVKQQALEASHTAKSLLECEADRLRHICDGANVLAAMVGSRSKALQKQLVIVEAENMSMHRECVRLKGVLGGLCDVMERDAGVV